MSNWLKGLGTLNEAQLHTHAFQEDPNDLYGDKQTEWLGPVLVWLAKQTSFHNRVHGYH